MKPLIIVCLLLAALAAGTGIAQAADRGDRVERRFDHKGDRIDRRLDRAGDVADHRLDCRGQRLDRRWDRRH